MTSSSLAGPPVLSIVGLKKTIKQNNVLNGVNLSLNPGEVVFLLGEDKSRSCLLAIIAGDSHAGRGDVFLQQQKINDDWLTQKKLLYIPRHGRRYTMGTIAGRVSYWQHKSKQPSFAGLLSIAGLNSIKDKKCLTLSIESRQRLSLAHALSRLPKLLLIDGALDTFPCDERVQILRTLSKAAHDSGMAVLYSTGHGEEALRFADRTAILWQGRIKQHDAPQALYDHPMSEAAATLTGECILLRGKATAVDEDAVLMNFDGLDLTCYSNMWISPGDSLLLCLRPECISWEEPADSPRPNTFPARLEQAQREGESCLLSFRLRNGQCLTFKRNLPSPAAILPGREYILSFDTAQCPLIAVTAGSIE